ncbi:MAG: hypothetical protein H6Q89_4819 [Myxococcaceae bacterium]|nr:hypothetical protein [Myxococcaceae bacterium]
MVALLVSLLVHVGLGVLSVLGVDHSPPPPAPPPSTDEWLIVEVMPAPPPPPLPPPIEAESPDRNRSLPTQRSRPTRPKESPRGIDEGPVASDAPRANAAPGGDAPFLVPDSSLSPQGEVEVPSGHGRTLFPDDPSLTPEAQRAEEQRRVERRVQGFAQDDLAQARAQSGVPHPYFAGVRDCARAELEKRAREEGVKATLGQFVGGMGHKYGESVRSYGKSGDPDLEASGNPVKTPDPVGGNQNELSGPMANSGETQLALRRNKPLVSLTLELRQFKDGRPLTAVVIHASGDPKFDALVLETWPSVIAQRGPPPPSAFHSEELLSIWTVEGWLGIPKKLEAVTTYLPMPFESDKLLAALSAEGLHYEFRARLVRVY